MDRYSDVVQNENGRAVAGASILILDQNNVLVTVYSSRQGGAQTNPIITDELGRWSFCAADGVYTAKIYLGGVLKATLPDIRLEDPSDDIGYILKPATVSAIGGVKPGSGLVVADDGTLSATGVAQGTVASVNGVTPAVGGSVTITTDNIAEGSNNQWFTAARVRSAVLTGLSVATNAAIAATDTVLTAFGKQQAQISANTTAIGSNTTAINANTTALGTKQDTAAKDASGGYAGLTGFALNVKNAAGTILSKIASAATVARTWTFPDKDGTVAMLSDLSTVSGGMVLLPNGVITVSSAVATIDFLNIFTSTYDKYVIEITDVVAPTGSPNLQLRLAKAGVVDATSIYTYGNGVAANQPSIAITGSVLSGSAVSSTIEIRNANSTRLKSVGVRGMYQAATDSTFVNTNPEQGYTGTTAVTGGRLFWNTGNFTTGTVRIYGIRNS
jgi:hypothetical protein